MTGQEQMQDLGRRAVACPGWRWMPGMLDDGQERHLGGGWWAYEPDPNQGCIHQRISDELPDLSDAATLGCLLALVREAWGPEAFAEPDGGGRWNLWADPTEELVGTYDAEAEALVAALEAAPRVSDDDA